MAHVHVGIGVKPAAYDWSIQSDVDQARPPSDEMSADNLARDFRKRRHWAVRVGVAASQRLAAALAQGDLQAASTARAIEKAQMGVGQTYRRVLVGKKRAAICTKPDASNATSPEYLDREASKRRGRLLSNIAASRAVGRTIAYACVCLTAAELTSLRNRLGEAQWRAPRGIASYTLDMVPQADGRGTVSLLLDLSEVASQTDLAAELGLRFSRVDEELKWLDALSIAARVMGPERWMNLYMDRLLANGGKRPRDFVTGGEWYGTARSGLIDRAANLQSPTDTGTEASRAAVEVATAVMHEAVNANDIPIARDALRIMREAVRGARALLKDRAPRSMALQQLELLVGRAATALGKAKRRCLDRAPMEIDPARRAELAQRLVQLVFGRADDDGSAARRWVDDFDIGENGERAAALANWLKPPPVPECRSCQQELTEPIERANRLCHDCMEGV